MFNDCELDDVVILLEDIREFMYGCEECKCCYIDDSFVSRIDSTIKKIEESYNEEEE